MLINIVMTSIMIVMLMVTMIMIMVVLMIMITIISIIMIMMVIVIVACTRTTPELHDLQVRLMRSHHRFLWPLLSSWASRVVSRTSSAD